MPRTDRRTGQPLPAALQVRLTREQHAHLTVQALRQDTGISTVLRDLVQRDLDAQPPIAVGEGADAGAMPYRMLLATADEAALEQLAAQLDGDGS
jgi:hypothetical protein